MTAILVMVAPWDETARCNTTVMAVRLMTHDKNEEHTDCHRYDADEATMNDSRG